jgi:uncharacterized membrane protein YqjE
MTDELEKWQQTYQQSTPKVDAEILLAKTRKLNRHESLKTMLELGFGVLISLFCIYALFDVADSWSLKVLFAVLAPIPASFGLWTYKQRGVLHATQSLDVKTLLAFNKANLLQKLLYWKVSSIIMSLLWMSLSVITVSLIVAEQATSVWLTILIVQTPIVIATILRYWFLKKSTRAQISKIAELQRSGV